MKLGSVCRADRAQSNGSTLEVSSSFSHRVRAVLAFTYGGLSTYMNITLVNTSSKGSFAVHLVTQVLEVTYRPQNHKFWR